MPIHGLRTTPCISRWSVTRRARLIGIAKPSPIEPPLGEKIELFTPITWPRALTRGPPEFPGLIDASVWIMSTYTPDPWPSVARFRPVPLTTPAVTLGSVLARRKPYGFPIAIAHSPTRRLEEF